MTAQPSRLAVMFRRKTFSGLPIFRWPHPRGQILATTWRAVWMVYPETPSAAFALRTRRNCITSRNGDPNTPSLQSHHAPRGFRAAQPPECSQQDEPPRGVADHAAGVIVLIDAIGHV